ncbi:MAG: prolyl oligopeptidase family serine peptidase [Pseudomonadota bacterium]
MHAQTAAARTADAVPSATAQRTADLPLPTVAELAALPNFNRPRLSPSGAMLAAFSEKDERQVVVVLAVASDIEPFLVAAPDWRINWFKWLADERLLVSVSVAENFFGTPVTVTRLILADPRARKLKRLLRDETGQGAMQIQDRLLSTLPDDPKRILLQINPDDAGNAQARLVSFRGRQKAGKIVQRILPQVSRMAADVDGNVRVGWGVSKDERSGVLRLRDGAGEWHDFSERYNAGTFNVLGIPVSDPDLLYVASDHEYPLSALYEFKVSTGTFGRRLAQHDDSEIADVELDAAGERIDSVVFSNQFVPDLILNPDLKALDAELDRMLPERRNVIVSYTPTLSHALIRSSASDLAPWYLLFDRAARKLEAYSPAYSQLHQRRLARTTVHQYEARDGLRIQAYITRPVDVPEDAALPFVVLPHGGPHSRDFLRFDWLTQLIASQGYGVLQMNFRGSTGYGREFEEAGYRQWGQAMQDDITDGTHWLIEQGWADPERIAIAGASYGGYAALMGAVREPELYRCAISLNGVSDLSALLVRESRFINGRYASRHIGRWWKDRKSLKENSPTQQAGHIQVPVLLAHGEADRVVNVRQSRMMNRRLKAAKVEHEYLELPEGDHFLSIGTNRRAFAERAVAFLQTHLAAAPER